MIAGALALEPTYLVADEPVASLDASVRGEILALLLQLRATSGLGALVITHDLGLAWNIADRVMVMHHGRIVENGTVEQVLLDPQHDYTKTLLPSSPPSKRAARWARPGTGSRWSPPPVRHPPSSWDGRRAGRVVGPRAGRLPQRDRRAPARGYLSGDDDLPRGT